MQLGTDRRKKGSQIHSLNSMGKVVHTLKGTNTQHSGHMVKNSQTELMVEIYSKSLDRAIGKVILMKIS